MATTARSSPSDRSVRYNLITHLLILAILSQTTLVESCSRSRVYLLNNEYHNIVIAINENVPENPQLLERIKEIFTDSSALLYEVTRYRAFFKGISILVPKSWQDKPEYDVPEFESYDKSDVIVDYPDEEADSGHRPYVINPTPCGEIGQYMHLTPQYILDETIASLYGPYEKTIVHEWAHLRWGVYDEYPSPTTGEYFYAGADGQIEATRCSLAITGRLRTISGDDCKIIDNLPEPDCRFQDARTDNSYSGSLMYKQFLPNIVRFCDNETHAESVGNLHNREAPNKQNQLCDGRSIWEVLREHGDFEEGANAPREIGNLIPDFRIVKQRNKRTVVVMDISGSMEENMRIEKLGQAVNNYIMNTLEDGESLGLVTFSQTADIRSYLVTINNSTRSSLLTHIPTRDDVGGWTSIGSGLLSGLEVLSNDGADPAGGVILIVTDGEENRNPRIEDVMPSLISMNVTVDSIAFSTDASVNLESLPAATDGKAFFYSEDVNSNALNEAFTTSAQRDKSVVQRPIQLHSNTIVISGRLTSDFDVVIDETIGRRTEFIFDYLGSEPIDVTLKQPNDVTIDKTSDVYELDETFQVVRITIPDMAQVGKWNVAMYNRDRDDNIVSVTVQSRSRNPDSYPIVVTSEWSNQDIEPPNKQTLYVSVSKGYVPVLKAVVNATVERPMGGPIQLIMFDNGAGADSTKDDGIYSSYFTEFSGADRYSVKVTVNSQPSVTTISPSRIVGVGAIRDPTLDPRSNKPDIPSGDFQRIANGGSFTCESDACSDTINDMYPPSTIMDLRLVEISYEDSEVTLSFTATGDNLDKGTVKRYQIWMDTNFNKMYLDYQSTTRLKQINITRGMLSSPKPAGESEIFTVRVPAQGDMSYVFSVVAIDNDSNKSKRSNIVTASMRDFTPTSASLSLPIIIAIATAGLLLAIIAIVAIAIYCYCRSKVKKDDEEETRDEKIKPSKKKNRKKDNEEENKPDGDDVAMVTTNKGEDEFENHTYEVVTTDEISLRYSTPEQMKRHHTKPNKGITALKDRHQTEHIYDNANDVKYEVPKPSGKVSNLRAQFEKS